ncbi:hypothetical protein [Rhizobium sp. S163]|uniref:DUF6894 family protein n=1 Tax=Rhizobium sp. S163 TaxID=3055039 RepID=UPI0025AA21DB|nr:hypothetical protein [Rhizobium sp. S163]MDM9644815.1 hypothetical protein [Rhizobium sp. S163]
MRFYFDIKSDDGADRDLDGIELPSLEAARNEAKKAAREMVAEMVLEDQRIDGMRFEILNERGEVLATVAFRELIN